MKHGVYMVNFLTDTSNLALYQNAKALGFINHHFDAQYMKRV